MGSEMCIRDSFDPQVSLSATSTSSPRAPSSSTDPLPHTVFRTSLPSTFAPVFSEERSTVHSHVPERSRARRPRSISRSRRSPSPVSSLNLVLVSLVSSHGNTESFFRCLSECLMLPYRPCQAPHAVRQALQRCCCGKLMWRCGCFVVVSCLQVPNVFRSK